MDDRFGSLLRYLVVVLLGHGWKQALIVDNKLAVRPGDNVATIKAWSFAFLGAYNFPAAETVIN